MNFTEAVLAGYTARINDPRGRMGSEAAQACQTSTYDPKLLSKIPQEIIDRDYGCGNPSKYANEGDIILDLGSGSGKICYILFQIVKSKGQVIGIDINREMIELSRSHLDTFFRKVGYNNLRFIWGSISNLAVDYDLVNKMISNNKLSSIDDLFKLETRIHKQCKIQPIIADNSIDLVVSNCVINLVDSQSKRNVFEEIFRVFKIGGRIALSDNVSNIEVPDEIKNDPDLWVSCYAGVYQEQVFYRLLQEVGFVGLTIKTRSRVSEKSIDNIKFYSVTVTAFKPRDCCKAQALGGTVLYKGPWSQVRDEAGLILIRGELTTVSSEQLEQLRHSIFANDLYFLPRTS